jgi:hypothetical protein
MTVARFVRQNAMRDRGVAGVTTVPDVAALRHEFAEPFDGSAAEVFVNPVVGRAIVNDEQPDALVTKDVVSNVAVIIEMNDDDALDPPESAHDAGTSVI